MTETILVVDDTRQIRDFLIDMILIPAGFQCLTAYDGLNCLEVVRRQRPDLILLDLQMPKLDGVQTIDRLNEMGSDIPIILMTGHGSEAIAVEVFRKGVKDYLIKGDENFTSEFILASVERALSEARLRRERDDLNERMIRRLSELNVLYNVGKSVAALMEVDGLMRRLVKAATMLTTSQEGAIYTLEEGKLFCRAVKRREHDNAALVNEYANDPVAMRAIEIGKTVAASSEPARAGRSNGRVGSMVSATMASPLVIGDKPIGALLVRNTVDGDFRYGDHERALLSVLSDYAAIAYNSQKQEKAPTISTETAQPKSIFVSYKRDDWDAYVNPLIENLRAKGMNVWIDQHLLEGGQDWMDKVNQALDECSAMVLCVSPESMKSQYVRYEYRYFFHQKKPIIPVILQPVAKMPAELFGFHRMNYSEQDKLVERLKLVLGG